MSLIRVDAISDDDGDEIVIEADGTGVYLTFSPAGEQTIASGCVALDTPELRGRFARAWAEAGRQAEAHDGH